MAIARRRPKYSRPQWWVELVFLVCLFLFIYALIGVALDWTGPYRPKTEIRLSFPALIHYAFLSLVRVSIGYVICLAFTLVYGYAAAKSKWGENILIPLLDILQSVPVLGFMPGLVLVLVGLFPHSNLGIELAAIFMIFTGQGWNMVFSFYSSLKSVPSELRELATLYGLTRLETLRTIELPYAMNGLIWNSMLSMAGGWFFLMTIESFSLGDKDFRLPGVGAYMAVAYEQNHYSAMVAAIIVMFVLIVLVDRCVWSPLVVWSQKFRMETSTDASQPSESVVLEWITSSTLVTNYIKEIDRLGKFLRRWNIFEKNRWGSVLTSGLERGLFRKTVVWLVVVAGAVLLWYGASGIYRLLNLTTKFEWLLLIRDTLLTFIRVFAATIIGAAWTIPVGVLIGLSPRLTDRLQPIVQIVASFPAPMLFPMLAYWLLRIGLGLEISSVLLMVLASQWYILFNVISGARLIPRHMIDLASVFGIRGMQYWRAIILPAIFPSLINGWITAAGGAWNACIVSEFVVSGLGYYSATGIGATITQAARDGDFPALASSLAIMVTTVVVVNRFVWGWLYRLAETKFRCET